MPLAPSRARRLGAAWLPLSLLIAACAPTAEPAAGPPAASGSDAQAPAVASPTVATTASAAATADPQTLCGALDCQLFDSPGEAFAHVLTQTPRVLAIGETHVQKGKEAIPSATKRFTETLLPMLQSRASDLVLELWVADGSCGKQEQQAAAQQKQVTKQQASGNTNEFARLRKRAHELGIRPHVLRPSCEQYREIVTAREDAVDKMLTMITRLTADMATKLLAAQPPGGESRMVVAYGGAMHNDLQPPPVRQKWSFGPELQQTTGGKYVELDIIVPEFIRDSASWKALPWYPHFNKDAHPEKTTLFRPADGSFVLIFPRSL